MSKKKIIALALLGIFIVFCIVMQMKVAFSVIESIIEFKDVENFEKFIYQWIFNAIVYFTTAIVLITCFVIILIKALKSSNASNFVRYTYEEYKEYREKKKAEKQAQKKAKLQEQQEKLNKQLQEMEKAE